MGRFLIKNGIVVYYYYYFKKSETEERWGRGGEDVGEDFANMDSVVGLVASRWERYYLGHDQCNHNMEGSTRDVSMS